MVGGGFRDNSVGKQPNKFVNNKQMMATNYNKQQFSKMTTGNPRVNEILLESQKMIYAPPSREKSKQTVRSPLLERNNGGIGGAVGVKVIGSALSSNTNGESEYLMSGTSYGVVGSSNNHFNMNKPFIQMNSAYGSGVAAAAINTN